MKRALVFVLVCALSACAAVQETWYGCGDSGFKGWDYQRECLRIVGAAR